MKRATRLIPALSQPLRASARPISVSLLSRPVAGPSTSTIYLSLRHNSTTAVPPTQPPASANGEEVPPNVTFEGLNEQADEEIERALAARSVEAATWFPTSSGTSEPILLPVSSLASPTPTLPSDANMVIALPSDVFGQRVRRDILHRCVVWFLSHRRAGTKQTKSRSTVNYSGHKMRPQKGTGHARQGDASSGTRRGGAPIHPFNPKDWAQALPRKVRDLGLRIALSSKLATGLLRVVPDLNEAGWRNTGSASRGLSNGLGDYIVEPTPEGVAAETAEAEAAGAEATSAEATEAEVVVETEALEGAAESGTAAETEAAAPLERKNKPRREVIPRFGPSKQLSILFLHSPLKPAEDVKEFTRVVRNIPGIEVLSADEVQVYHILKSRWLVMEGDVVDWFSGEAQAEMEAFGWDREGETEWTGEEGEVLPITGEGEAAPVEEATPAETREKLTV
ncbi:50S ribosomal protein L4 [Cryptococcus sp. DSM 104549]